MHTLPQTKIGTTAEDDVHIQMKARRAAHDGGRPGRGAAVADGHPAVQLSKNAAFSCQILAAHPMRTLLSITGVVAGIAAVILIVAFGQAAERRILDSHRPHGHQSVTVNAAPARLMIGRQRTVGTVTTLTVRDAQAIATECAHVVAAVSAVYRSLVVHGEGRNTTTTIVGMSADGFCVRAIPISSGRPFDAGDDRLRKRVAVLGQTVRRNIFGSADPVGQEIRIGRGLFEVVATVRLRGTDATVLGEFYQGPRDRAPMNKPVDDALKTPGTRLGYVSDFGSTTELIVSHAGVVEATSVPKVQVAARNEAPQGSCEVCGQPATTLCAECG